MRRSASIVVLAVLVVALAAANLALRPSPLVRGVEFLPAMVKPIPYESFGENPFFGDGKTLQLPPEGTVRQGEVPLHFAPTPEDAIRAGVELVNPIDPSPEALARGAAVWASFCQVCHGPEAKGDGPVAQRGFPAPPSLHAEKALALKDGQIFHILTYGQANMPSYAAQLAPEDRWRVIHAVRELQRRETERLHGLAETQGVGAIVPGMIPADTAGDAAPVPAAPQAAGGPDK